VFWEQFGEPRCNDVPNLALARMRQTGPWTTASKAWAPELINCGGVMQGKTGANGDEWQIEYLYAPVQ